LERISKGRLQGITFMSGSEANHITQGGWSMMIIGVPKEIKDNEYRVSLTPGGAHQLVEEGHRVLVQRGAGDGSGFTDDEYAQTGAELIADAAEVWRKAEMIMKVKEPLHQEYQYLREGLILYTYLHLAADEELTRELMKDKVTGIAYETVELPNGLLPLLTPMSEVAWWTGQAAWRYPGCPAGRRSHSGWRHSGYQCGHSGSGHGRLCADP
jgi:hypothetical protein